MSIIQVESIMREHALHARAPYEPDYEDGSAFCNGRYVPIDQGAVPITDPGFLHADAAYDVVTVSRGNFFRLEDHLSRLEQSCERFLLSNPYSRDQMREILNNLVAKSGMKDAYVWWSVTRGTLERELKRRIDPARYDNGMYAFVAPYFFQAPDEIRNRGFNILISKRYRRIPPKSVDPTAKNFHWMDMKLALYEAGAAGKDWAVLVGTDGNLAEAPGANIFIVKNGELFTPAEGCLEGITRRSVLELAAELGVKANLTTVTPEELVTADEAFTCTSAGGIMPIGTVDDKQIGSKAGAGPITEQLHNMYWEKRWSGWHATPVDYSASAKC